MTDDIPKVGMRFVHRYIRNGNIPVVCEITEIDQFGSVHYGPVDSVSFRAEIHKDYFADRVFGGFPPST
jgi:hypothetical protein